MTSEGKLAPRREDAQLRRIRQIVRLRNEDCLRQVELARDCLHGDRVERVGIMHHGERIAAEAAISEHVESVIVERHASGFPCAGRRTLPFLGLWSSAYEQSQKRLGIG